MAEHHQHHESHHAKPESHEVHLSPEAHEAQRAHAEHHRHNAEQAEHHAQKQHEMGEQARRVAEQEALRKEEVQPLPQHEQRPHLGGTLVTAELVRSAQKRTLTRIRKQLSAPDKVLSRIVHQPIVDAVSEVGAKTVARPSGVLSGGIIALIGTSVYLYIAKHYGYTYNFLVFALLFVSGFLLGLVIEFAVSGMRRTPNP